MADLPVPSTSAEELRRIAEEVLSQPQFAEARPQWWERVLVAIGDFFADIVAAVSAGDRGSIIGTLVLVAVVLAAAAAVVRYTSTVRGGAAMPVPVDVQVGRAPREWLAEAEAHERSEQWRDAVRCRYRALLAELAGAGIVEEVAGRTSGEYRAAVAAELPAAAAAFDDATRVFDRAWYGHDPAAPHDVTALQDAARRTLREAGVRRPLAGAHR